MPIRFFCEEVKFRLPHPTKTKKWLTLAVQKENKAIKNVNYIFCSDVFLLELNRKYLNHDTLTDIITFDESIEKTISGEIYISIDRVAENADLYQCDFLMEVKRIMIHGVLHLCGYSDKRKSEKILMREKEDTYLSLWYNLFHVKRSS